jgi:hypothetical protein
MKSVLVALMILGVSVSSILLRAIPASATPATTTDYWQLVRSGL